MPHFIEVDSDEGIFIIKYVGNVSLRDRISAVDELYSELKDTDDIKVLIDVRELINVMTEDEQEYFVHYLSEKHDIENSKVATLYSKDKPNPNAIIESLAYLNGYSMTPFNSRKEAILWLNGKIK